MRTILVPLDGSALAEAALPGAVWLAKQFQSGVSLLHVIEHNAPERVHGERHLTNEAEALAYLGQIAARLGEGVEVHLHVHTEEVRNVPRSIAQHIEEMDVAAVAMCSHGRGGLRDWMVGSIAQQVIGLGSAPVLLVQPGENQDALFNAPQCLLVALDDHPEHACGLELAIMLAEPEKITLRLVNVVPTPEDLRGAKAASSRLLPVTTAALLEALQEQAAQFLREMAQAAIQKQLKVSIEVRRGDPPLQIAQAAQNAHASLIVLGTHGKAGMNAFWSGSVAARMPGVTTLPLLLVPTCSVNSSSKSSQDTR